MRARLATFLALAAVLLLALPAAATAATGWHSQQPAGAGSHPLLGEVGDVECWSANRCTLITSGNAGVEAGIFAYDGSAWYRYSTVCGGHEGRIAWAGPTEFWTISDQQVGQTVIGNEQERYAVSLCHFKDGKVVASYGEPLQSASSYRKMTAASCAASSGECWFGGVRLSETTSVNPGAFHLRWNGSALTPVPSPSQPVELEDPGRAIADLAFHRGSFYEGIDVNEGDVPSSVEEDAGEASFLHRLDPTAATPFQPLFSGPLSFGGGDLTKLAGFLLSGGDEEDLWAVAGAESEAARPVALRFDGETLAQLPLEDPGGVLGLDTGVASIAAEAGEQRVWVALRRSGEGTGSLTFPSRLTRIDSAGNVAEEVTLPPPGEMLNGEPVGRKGIAGPIECSGADQCWLATSKGWLFHYGDDPVTQSDPALHTLITSRPADNSLPALPPLELPEDTSGLEEGTSSQEEPPVEFEESVQRKPALLSKIKQRMIGTTLELKFTLSARARVWLVAKLKGRVVARTQRQTMGKGRRSIRLRLDPDRWPNKLDLKASKVKSGKVSK